MYNIKLSLTNCVILKRNARERVIIKVKFVEILLVILTFIACASDTEILD